MTALHNIVLMAPAINGTNKERLNGARIEYLDEDNWVFVTHVLDLEDGKPKLFELGGVKAKSLRLLHGDKISSGCCLGVGMVRINVLMIQKYED
jgi:hypothetical protein